MINFSFRDGNSHHILHLSFDHYESKSNVSRILDENDRVSRSKLPGPTWANTVCFTTGRKVQPVFILHGYDTTASILPSTIATVHSRNPLHPLDICTEPRCPAFS